VRAFLDSASEISIAAQRPRYRVDPTEVGCSPDMLAQALSEPGAAKEADDPVSAGLQAAVAGLRLRGGEISESVGEPGLIERLKAFAAGGLATLDRVMGSSAAQPSCAILPGPAPRELILACIASGDEKAVILAPGDTLAHLAALCRSAA